MRRSTVADVMSTPAVAVTPGTSFASVAELLYTAAVRAVPVLDADGRLLGVVSEADLLVTAESGDPQGSRHWWRPRHVRRPGPTAKEGAATAADLMTTSVVTIGPDAGVAAAARTLREHGVSWMPVVDGDGRVVGILGRSDLLAVFLRDDTAIRDEVVTEVFDRLLRIDPAQVAVTVTDGVVTLAGELETRADTRTALRLVERLEGVVGVHDRLSYRVDERWADSRVAPRY